MSKLTLDLHPFFNKGDEIEKQLAKSLEKAILQNAVFLEIIHGKGTKQLKKRVDRFLQKPENKSKFKRVKHDTVNHGRLFVYF
jgi:dsDNA-specific endonuclease/ATPase MutS2